MLVRPRLPRRYLARILPPGAIFSVVESQKIILGIRAATAKSGDDNRTCGRNDVARLYNLRECFLGMEILELNEIDLGVERALCTRMYGLVVNNFVRAKCEIQSCKFFVE